MEQSKKKQLIVSILAIVLLIVATVGVTYAFFNYTRTGTANIVSTGTINFTSSQDGRINITNIFPINPEETGIMDDNTKVGTVAITVTGDTTYDNGVEYLVSAVNVNNTVGTKTIPISISATASGTLGTSDENYFEDRDTSTSHIYKVLAKNTISNNDQLMVGYIANNATGINGTITIKAYIDKNKIAISDTYNSNGTPTDTNGTTSQWVDGRTVFTTTEWNSLQGTGVSFQVRVEANEGIWVIDKERNDMVNIYSANSFASEQKSSITEINFIKSTEDEINTHVNLIDLTDSNGNGIVKGWIENNKLYIASPGTTYFPEDSTALFSGFTNVANINFENINTSKVTNMTAMFHNCSSLTTIDLSDFDTSKVTSMDAMFSYSINLVNIDLSGLGSDKLISINGIFDNCTKLTNIDMSNFNFGTVSSFLYDSNKGCLGNLVSVETITLKNAKAINLTSLEGAFNSCPNLTMIDLSGFNTGSVTIMAGMFYNCPKLTTIYVSSDWNVNNVTASGGMFGGCTSLKGGGSPQTTYDANHTDKEYARIDGGANSSTPGYLTLKTN